MGAKTKTFTVGRSNGVKSTVSKLSRIKLTDGERKKLQERIKKADSLEEIIRLEKELKEGRLPSGILGAESTDEDAMVE